MQLIIHLRVPKPVTLPMDYAYRLSSAIYRSVSSDMSYSSFLHDQGYGENEHYKLFVFSPLKGHYIIKDKHIIFDGPLSFEVRSASKRFCDALKTTLINNGKIKIMDTVLEVVMTEVYDAAPALAEAEIRTVSPIIVSYTANRYTTFFSPEDECWDEMINKTLYRKFMAAYNEDPPSTVQLSLSGRPKKIVSRIKGNYVTAYHAEFHLEAHPLVTQFLYETGLGSKNSQGFGMFEIIGGEQ